MRGLTAEVGVEADTAAEADAAGVTTGMAEDGMAQDGMAQDGKAEDGMAEDGMAAFEVAGSTAMVAFFMVRDLRFMGIRGGVGGIPGGVGVTTAAATTGTTTVTAGATMVTTAAPTPRPTVEVLRSSTPLGQSRQRSHGEGSTAGVLTG
jgi:hypothetical protein